MAVFQGVRQRTIAFPGRTRAARITQVPRATQAPLVSRSRIGPIGKLIAVILTATMLGLVYLTQTLASNAASAEIGSLVVAQGKLHSRILNQGSYLSVFAGSEKVAEQAVTRGLVPLGDPVILEAP